MTVQPSISPDREKDPLVHLVSVMFGRPNHENKTVSFGGHETTKTAWLVLGKHSGLA